MDTPRTVRKAGTEDVVRVLQQLADTCLDGEQGYREAAERVSDPAMKALFAQNGYQRAVFVEELERVIAELGSEPNRAPSGPIVIHRGWVQAGERAHRGDRMVLAECDAGETATRKSYEAAMREVPLAAMPGRARSVVQRQYASLLEAHALIQKHMWTH